MMMIKTVGHAEQPPRGSPGLQFSADVLSEVLKLKKHNKEK